MENFTGCGRAAGVSSKVQAKKKSRQYLGRAAGVSSKVQAKKKNRQYLG
jgi:hypothetical protein